MKYTLILKRSLLAALLATAGQTFSQSLNPLTIGTIHPGDSVVIYYDATINSSAGTQVSSQGTLSGDNFVTFSTDDPDTGPTNDATVTLLNMFPLPVTLLEFKAAKKVTGVEVVWKVASESNLIRYEVERSSNGSSFQKIGEMTARNSVQTTGYALIDLQPNTVNYYRLKMIEQNGFHKYSNVIRLDLAAVSAVVGIYPNPVYNSQMTVQLNNLARGNYNVDFFNQAGQLVYMQTINHEGGSLNKTLSLPPSLGKGVYRVQVRNEKVLTSQMLLLQ